MRINQARLSKIVFLFAVLLLVVLPIQIAKAQTTTVSVSPQSSAPSVGQTLTISIQISNVQNLYGLDVALNWNPSMLSLLTNQSFVGLETYSNGVLYSPTFFVEDSATQQTGEYHLVVTSENPASSFNGSGTIATLTFKVTSAGQSSLTVLSTLADRPAPDENSEPITHNDVSGTVDATSSSTTSSPTSSSTSSTSPTVPEFPMLAMLTVVIVLVSSAVVLSRKSLSRTGLFKS